MKTLLLIGALLLATTTANAVEWQASCNSYYKNWFGKYTFEVNKGEVGGCPTDSEKHFTGRWDWSERAEVKSREEFGYGKYEWSGTVNIDRPCKPAYRSTIVQVHGGHSTSQRPMGNPSFLATNYVGKFRGTRNKGTLVDVPINTPFDVVAKVDFTKKYVKTSYFVNGEHVLTEMDKQKTDKIFFKFGVYRVNSNCTIKQTYTKVKLKRVK